MKIIRNALVLMAVIASLWSCASAPMVVKPSASVRLMTVDELQSAYGYNFAVNPYLEPSSLIRGKPYEFSVLRIEIATSENAAVAVSAKVLGADGSALAEAKDLEQMKLLWDMWEGKDSDKNRRLTSLERSYLPGPSFVQKPGSRVYYLVLTGKYPYPRPATVEVSLLVEGLDPVTFSQALPELPKKK